MPHLLARKELGKLSKPHRLGEGSRGNTSPDVPPLSQDGTRGEADADDAGEIDATTDSGVVDPPE